MSSEYGFPFDAVNTGGAYDREYRSEDFRGYFSKFVTNGVWRDYNDMCQVTTGAGMQVVVKSGSVFINGAAKDFDQTALTLAAASSTLPRNDLVVARLSISERKVTLAVLTGTPATTPADPTLTRNDTVWELSLARVNVRAGVTSPTVADITDLRGEENCGYVSQLIQTKNNTKSFQVVVNKANFTESAGVWTQSINVVGMLNTYYPQCLPIVDTINQATRKAQLEAYTTVSCIVTNNGSIKIICDAEPQTNFTLYMEVIA